MLKIKKLRLKNFKSFKKAEIPFSNGFTSIAGANASGKCVVGETLVLTEKGTYERIDRLVENALSNSKQKHIEDGVIGFDPKEKVLVYSLNPDTLKIEPAQVNAFVKRTAPDKLLKVRTASGREVITTDYHPFFGIKDGEIFTLKASELTAGTIIATPREIENTEKNKLFEELFDQIVESDNIFASFNKTYLEVVERFVKEKRLTINDAAKELGVKPVVLEGLKARQGIKLANLIKILKNTGHTNEAIADLVPQVKGKNSNKTVKMPWRNSKELSRLLGYFFAEGSIAGDNVRLVTQNQEIIQDIQEICLKVFGEQLFVKKYKPNAYDLIIFSHPVAKIIQKFCLKENCNARHKKVESIFFSHSDEEISEFLNGYFCGDGYVSKNSISATTASKDLAFDIFSMLLMVGITPRLSKVEKGIKKRGFRGTYYTVSAYGKENMQKFSEKINLIHKGKNSKLGQENLKRSHTNVDLIPNLGAMIKETCIEHDVQYARKKNKNIKLKSYTDNACFPSRNGLQEVLEKEFSTVKNPSRNLMLLQKLAFSDIFWDTVEEITEEKRNDKFVYDLSITYNHNFIANNIVVHNSNIMDSLLFVLGITSMKLLRVPKISELINHDATEDYAKVEVEFEDGEKQFAVSRMIDIKGTSTFRIDNQKVTLNEISELLLGFGVKPTGHNFVVQGDITRVIEMNAKQRREIIDEVAGLSEFEEKKAEAIKKLEEVESRVKDAHLVLSEREKYLFELEEEKKAVQKFNELKEELEASKATILRVEARKIDAELSEAKAKIEVLKEEIARRQEDKNSFFTQESELEKKLEELNERLIEASAKTYATIGREIEETKAQIKIVRHQIESIQSRLTGDLEREKSLGEEGKRLLSELEEKKEEISRHKNQLLPQKARLEELEKQLALKSDKRSSYEGEVKKLQKNAQELAKEENRLREQYLEAKSAAEKAQAEKDFLERTLVSLTAEFSKAQKQAEENIKMQSALRQLDPKKLDERILENEKEIEEAQSHSHSIRGKIDALNDSSARLTGLKNFCPTCSQNIDKKKVSELFSENSEKIMVLSTQENQVLAKKSALLAEKKELYSKKEEARGLLARLSSFEGAKDRERDLQEKINSATDKMRTYRPEVLSAQQAELKQKLEACTKDRLLATQKLDMMLQDEQAKDFNELLATIKSLTSQKNENENRVATLETHVIHGIEKRLSVIGEETKGLSKMLLHSRQKIGELEKEAEKNSKELEKKEVEMQKATQNSRMLEEEKQRVQTKAKNIDEKRKAVEEKIVQKEKQLNELLISMSKNEIRANDLSEELKGFEGAKTLENTNTPDLKRRVAEIGSEIRGLGAMNMKALERFDELKKEVVSLRDKAFVLDNERKAVIELIGKIDLKKKEVFMQCFMVISRTFSDLYFHFFGGEGKLSLTESDKPLEGGLLIEAKYKENKLKNIDSMSGGEKSLTALAFMFAIQSFEPAPFYVFDEADAALDRENSGKLGAMIRQVSKTSQFIAITHNDAIIKSADQIIGVALNQQKSSVIGLKLKEKVEEQNAAAQA